ncbi:MBL fold metallo-hydrolase [Ruminiclostridium papyrosolvens]|uniref:Beta-lactamase n=1 Tax=Ruminiclostridium papyrosolvens C7 TaxID=1330534 RepID=U4R574_9FIRM|nr:MBL fold metallo-hydrolase [Ruminiclostridium papyrosolvens]EPR13175.1 beta-lactamase [Ruminiclostridium papyrosolvens C7]
MFVKPINGGLFDSVSYLVGNGREAVLIDAGVPADKVLTAQKELNTNIKKIILTHGHIDHILHVDDIVQKTNAMVYIHIDDEQAMTDARFNVSAFTGTPSTFQSKYEILRDGNSIKVGELDFKIIHTPGHSAGSICIQVENLLFSGDTLFKFGYGRVDLPNGNFSDIYNSIVEKLFVLHGETVVYPGHGGSTTIIDEIRSNPIKNAIQW